jgi:putative oxidoreductase
MRNAIAGALLGLIFVFASAAYFLHLAPTPAVPPGSPIALFMGALIPTHYMDFVKVFELSGGVLVAIPATRRLGLLLLGPVIMNILAFHIFIARGGFGNPLMIGAVALGLYLLWAERRSFAAFIAGTAAHAAPLQHPAWATANASLRADDGRSLARTTRADA